MSRESGERLNSKNQITTEDDARYFNEIYEGQLEWTVTTRKRLYRQMNLYHVKSILEVGSGTGSLLREITQINPKIKLVGIDNNIIALNFSNKMETQTNHVLGEGVLLPFSSKSFDISLCHYFLMWVKDPVSVLREMLRVTRIGGWVACIAEPDYGGRIDYPASEIWKELMLESLSAPNPFIGRKLRTYFYQVGLKALVGLQSTVLSPDTIDVMYKLEIEKLSYFLPEEKREKLEKLKKTLELKSSSEMFSFMPVFFALAQRHQ